MRKIKISSSLTDGSRTNGSSSHDFFIGQGQPLCIMTGPCVIENESHAFQCAETLKKMFENKNINFIFKASFDKANRSSIHSFRGPGIDKGLQILSKIKKELQIPVISDIHLPSQADMAKDVLDIIQIPAFLCRQTDLIIAAAKTKKPLNIKKAQFMSPYDMKNVVIKAKESGCEDIILTDRGTSFGYNNLITDITAIPIMQSFGCPVCFDATHSVQKPGGLGCSSGGAREFIPTLIKSAIAAGCNSLFIESHPNPPEAKCDSASVMPFDSLKAFLCDIEKLYNVIQEIG